MVLHEFLGGGEQDGQLIDLPDCRDIRRARAPRIDWLNLPESPMALTYEVEIWRCEVRKTKHVLVCVGKELSSRP